MNGKLIKPQFQGTIPTQQLPGTAPTPESYMEDQFGSLKNNFQERLHFEWDTIIKQGKKQGLSNRQINHHLAQLSHNAQAKAIELKQKVQMQQQQFQRIDQLAQSGAFTNPDEVKWRMTLGPEAEAAMFPKPEEQSDPLKQFGDLETIANKVESDLKQYRLLPAGKIPSWWRPQKFEKTAPTELQVFDPTLQGAKMKSGEYRHGDYRPATLEDIRDYGQLVELDKQIKRQQQAAMSGGSLLRTATQSDRISGGPIKDQVKAYMQQGRQLPDNNDPLGLR